LIAPDYFATPEKKVLLVGEDRLSKNSRRRQATANATPPRSLASEHFRM
jgi:hypothetical protein